MYGKAVSGLLGLIIIALGIGFFVWQSSDHEKTYKNSVYGYALTYPSTLDVKEYTDDTTVFGTVSADAVDAVVEARVVTAQGEAGQTVQDAIAVQLSNFCAADGPESSFSCNGILSTEPYATENGDAGFVLTLKGELKDIKSGTVTIVPTGPYYVLIIASSATISRALVVSPPEHLAPTEINGEVVRAVAESAYLSK
jgi:hypothetical protein